MINEYDIWFSNIEISNKEKIKLLEKLKNSQIIWTLTEKELLEKGITAMMNYLGDDYTGYLNNDNTNDLMTQLAGKYNGIGVAINNEDKSITKVYDDTPASKA